MSTRERRGFAENPCYFITTTFNDWIPLFITEEYYNVAADSLNFYGKQYNSDTICYCLMPNHIHFIIFFNQLSQCSNYMRDFKKYTSGKIRRMLARDQRDELQQLRYEKGEQIYKVWKDRYHAVIIRNKDVLLTKMKYIHDNPVKKGLVEEDWEWKWSSADWYKNRNENEVILRHAWDII